MKVFNLPDLGEGLPDAEIIEWHVAEGGAVVLDEPLVSMETAKAVVEVPSPYTGKLNRQHGQPGDVIETGKPLADFALEGEADVEVKVNPEPENQDSESSAVRADSGTVVGTMESSDTVVTERLTNVAGVKVTPAVRALARKLKVDLAGISPSGKDDVVTRADVEQAASNPQPAAAATSAEWEAIRGPRRTMARVMSESHAQVVPTSLMDDANIHQWALGQDMTVRLLRSMWAGASAEPGLNAWYDPKQNLRLIHKGMDVGMAVDTADGLFAAALRDVHSASAENVRAALNRLRQHVENRSIPPQDLKDYTIMLSNFGMFAGRYATPVITPPCVCIIAAGKARQSVVPVLGGLKVHRILPLSLTFDHRACTGGEAARFLQAMLADLGLPE